MERLSLYDILIHELAHAIAADVVGARPIDIISSKHPEADPDEIAALRLERRISQLDTPLALMLLLSGAAANTLYGDIPFEKNGESWHDFQRVKELLEQRGIFGEEAQDQMKDAYERVCSHLMQPRVMNAIMNAAETREPGLPETHHFSKQRLRQIVLEANVNSAAFYPGSSELPISLPATSNLRIG